VLKTLVCHRVKKNIETLSETTHDTIILKIKKRITLTLVFNVEQDSPTNSHSLNGECSCTGSGNHNRTQII
jgi:hypothetical protein